jgi:hypothetical protein
MFEIGVEFVAGLGMDLDEGLGEAPLNPVSPLPSPLIAHQSKTNSMRDEGGTLRNRRVIPPFVEERGSKQPATRHTTGQSHHEPRVSLFSLSLSNHNIDRTQSIYNGRIFQQLSL